MQNIGFKNNLSTLSFVDFFSIIGLLVGSLVIGFFLPKISSKITILVLKHFQSSSGMALIDNMVRDRRFAYIVGGELLILLERFFVFLSIFVITLYRGGDYSFIAYLLFLLIPFIAYEFYLLKSWVYREKFLDRLYVFYNLLITALLTCVLLVTVVGGIFRYSHLNRFSAYIGDAVILYPGLILLILSVIVKWRGILWCFSRKKLLPEIGSSIKPALVVMSLLFLFISSLIAAYFISKFWTALILYYSLAGILVTL